MVYRYCSRAHNDDENNLRGSSEQSIGSLFSLYTQTQAPCLTDSSCKNNSNDLHSSLLHHATTSSCHIVLHAQITVTNTDPCAQPHLYVVNDQAFLAPATAHRQHGLMKPAAWLDQQNYSSAASHIDVSSTPLSPRWQKTPPE